MKSYNVRFLEVAVGDLEEIVMYIAKDSKEDATKLYNLIIEKAKRLATFPNLGRQVPDKKICKIGFRMVIISSYIMFYRVIDEDVVIYRILHGRRNYPNLFEEYK